MTNKKVAPKAPAYPKSSPTKGHKYSRATKHSASKPTSKNSNRGQFLMKILDLFKRK